MNLEISSPTVQAGFNPAGIGQNKSPQENPKKPIQVTQPPMAEKEVQTAPSTPAAISFDPSKSLENLKTAVKLLNEQLTSSNRGLGFSFDESKKTPVIKVTDLTSGEVIRQIPSEDLLKLAHRIDEFKGILFDNLT